MNAHKCHMPILARPNGVTAKVVVSQTHKEAEGMERGCSTRPSIIVDTAEAPSATLEHRSSMDSRMHAPRRLLTAVAHDVEVHLLDDRDEQPAHFEA